MVLELAWNPRWVNHVRELVRHIHVRHLNGGGCNLTAGGIRRLLDHCFAGVIRFLIQTVSQFREPRSVGKLSDSHLRYCLLDAVGICAGQDA